MTTTLPLADDKKFVPHKVTIDRQGTHFSVVEAFEQCKKAGEEFWHQNEDRCQQSINENHGLGIKRIHKIPFFPNALSCCPSVKVTFRGPKLNVAKETDFFVYPETRDIQFFNNGNEPNGALKFTKAEELDLDQQYIVIDIMDNDQTTGQDDRVIGESIIIFGENFCYSGMNYCCIPLHDVYEQKYCGQIALTGQWIEDTHELRINILWILNLTDFNVELIKGADTTIKDIIILIIWLSYMILSFMMYVYIEDLSWIDAIYVRFVTAFTVGYGDIFPKSDFGKVFNSCFIIIDTVAIGYLTSKAMSYILRWREMQEILVEFFREIAVMAEREIRDAKNQEQRQSILMMQLRADTTARSREIEVKQSQMEFEKKRDLVKNRELEKIEEERKKILKLVFIVFMIIVFIVSGTLVMTYGEGYELADAVQWNFVTLSTVGYGDVVPKTTSGKVFTIIYIMFGVSLLVYFAGTVFDFLAARKAKKYKEQVMRRALISEAQLLEFDLDGDGKIDRYEFLSKMLVETGECEQSKIDEIIQQFTKLDKDNNNFITTEELRDMERI